MHDEDLNICEQKKVILFQAIGKVVLRNRKILKKGINKFSFEYDIANGLLSRLENGKSDTKISTLWKLSNAFNISFTEFAKQIEDELPKDFCFYD